MKFNPTPSVQDADIALSPAELEVLRRQYIKEGEYATIQTKFNYAWGLIRSTKPDHIELGIKLLTEIYTDAPERRRECLYFLAIGNYKISNYSEARRFNDQLLKLEPRNEQAASLKKLIDDKVSTEGVIGLAIVSGVVAVGAALIAAVVKHYHKIRFKERRRTNTELVDIPRFIVKPKNEYLKHRKHPTSKLALQPLNDDVFITKPKNDNKMTPRIPLKRAIDALKDDISDQPDDLSVSTRSKTTHELQDTQHENQVENTQEMHPTQDTVQSDTIPQVDVDMEKQTVRSSSFFEKELTDVESLAYTQTIDSQLVRNSMLNTQGEEQLEDEEMTEVTHLKSDELKEIEKLEGTEQAMDVQVEQTEMQLEKGDDQARQLEVDDDQIKQTEADDDQARQLEVDDDMQAEQTEIQLEIEQKETELVGIDQLEMEDAKQPEEEIQDELVRDDAQSAYGYDGMELLNNDALADEQPIASPISKLSEGIDDLAFLDDKASDVVDAHRERLDEVIDELKSSIRSNYQSKSMKLRDIQAEVLDSVIVKVIKDEKNKSNSPFAHRVINHFYDSLSATLNHQVKLYTEYQKLQSQKQRL
ncbi:mitochondrial membrane protein, partial [Rhizopus azygosporus]